MPRGSAESLGDVFVMVHLHGSPFCGLVALCDTQWDSVPTMTVIDEPSLPYLELI